VLGFTPFPYQMKMLEDQSQYVVVCAARRVGKSLVMAGKALWFALCHPGTSTIIVASTQRQSMLMFDKLLDFVSASPLLSESVVRKTRTIITFTNGSRIVALPCGRSGSTIRGENAHLVILDEASFIPEEVILSVMMPMLSTTDGKIIMLSTPFDKEHFFYRAFNMPLWSKYRFTTSDNPLVKKEFLHQQLEMLGERAFRRESEAEFVDDENTFFPMSILRPCVHVCSIRNAEDVCEFCSMYRERVIPSGDLYGGYDAGGMVDCAAFVAVQKLSRQRYVGRDGNNGEKDVAENERPIRAAFNPAFRVVFLKTFLADKKKKKRRKNEEEVKVGGEIYSNFNLEIADIHRKYPLRGVLMDSTGIGSPILSHCRELGLPAFGENLHRKNQEEKLSNLKILLERRQIELPDDMELLSSLNCIVAERNRIGGYVFSHPGGTHDDLAYALALAVWIAGKGRTVVMMKKEEEEEPEGSSVWRMGEP
jgi:hypothetical protein